MLFKRPRMPQNPQTPELRSSQESSACPLCPRNPDFGLAMPCNANFLATWPCKSKGCSYLPQTLFFCHPRLQKNNKTMQNTPLTPLSLYENPSTEKLGSSMTPIPTLTGLPGAVVHGHSGGKRGHVHWGALRPTSLGSGAETSGIGLRV